jgi:hypothetical protein
MRIWRLLVEIGPEVWTFVAAAPDHTRAWQAVRAHLEEAKRELAFLEELEATTAVVGVQGPSRVMHAWRTAPSGPTGASRRASTAA